MTRDATGNVRKKFLTPTKLENVSTYYLHTSTPHRKTSMLGALRNQKCPGRGMGGGGGGGVVSVQREGLNLVVLYGNIERDFPMSCLHTHFTRVDDPGGGSGVDK